MVSRIGTFELVFFVLLLVFPNVLSNFIPNFVYVFTPNFVPAITADFRLPVGTSKCAR
jgi:hypothetical protein